MEDGSGLGKLMPALNGNENLNNTQLVVCKIYNGYNADSLGMTMRVMPSFDYLSKVQMANLINFLNQQWASSKQHYNIDEITTMVEVCSNK